MKKINVITQESKRKIIKINLSFQRFSASYMIHFKIFFNLQKYKFVEEAKTYYVYALSLKTFLD